MKNGTATFQEHLAVFKNKTKLNLIIDPESILIDI